MITLDLKRNFSLTTINSIYKPGLDRQVQYPDIDKLACKIYDSLSEIVDNVNNINGKIIFYKYYETVPGTSSGNQVNVPTGGTIELDRFGSSGDAVLSRVDLFGRPTYESPKDAGGNVLTTSLDSSGTYVFSVTPTNTNVAIIYCFSISIEDCSNVDTDFIIAETELVPNLQDVITQGGLFFGTQDFSFTGLGASTWDVLLAGGNLNLTTVVGAAGAGHRTTISSSELFVDSGFSETGLVRTSAGSSFIDGSASGQSGRLTTSWNNINLKLDFGGTEQSIDFTTGSGMVVTDTENSIGLTYAADYSGNYTNRSLVDKEYVDGLIPGIFTGPGTTGLVPDPVSSTGRFLKDDGTWDTVAGGGEDLAATLTLGNDGNPGQDIILHTTGKFIVDTDGPVPTQSTLELGFIGSEGVLQIPQVAGASKPIRIKTNHPTGVVFETPGVFRYDSGSFQFIHDFTGLAGSNKTATWRNLSGTVAYLADIITNLGIANKTATTLDVTSDTGTDATIPEATITEAGLLNATDKVKLNNTSGNNCGDEVSATESVEGIAELATQDETNTKTDDTRIVTPLKLANRALYGEVHMQANGTATIITAVNTPVKIAGTTTNGLASADITLGTNSITYTGTPTRRVKIQASISSHKLGGGTQDFTYYVSINGSVVVKSGIQMQQNTQERACVAQCIVDINTNDFVEAWVENNSGTNNVNIEFLNIILNDID